VNATHVPRGLWLAIGTATSSGVSVEWFVRELLESSGSAGLQELTALAESSALGSNRVVYLPYLQGERTPIWDPAARGCFFGLSSTTTRGDLARAVLEGTAFGLKHILDSLEEVAGGPVDEIRTVGGGTKNPLWNQIKADVLRKPLAVLEFQETSSLGAALLGGMGIGLYGSLEAAAAVARSANSARRVEPDEGRAARYDELLDVFTELYPATRTLAHRLARPDRGD
jgi:xylulokinase